MELDDIRQRRLSKLLEERFDGVRKRLADAIHKDPSYISRVLSDGPNRKGLGEKFARHVEKCLQLPRGWLDEENGDHVSINRSNTAIVYGLPITENAARIGHKWEQLHEPVRAQIAMLIETLTQQGNNDPDAVAPRPTQPPRQPRTGTS